MQVSTADEAGPLREHVIVASPAQLSFDLWSNARIDLEVRARRRNLRVVPGNTTNSTDSDDDAGAPGG